MDRLNGRCLGACKHRSSSPLAFSRCAQGHGLGALLRSMNVVRSFKMHPLSALAASAILVCLMHEKSMQTVRPGYFVLFITTVELIGASSSCKSHHTQRSTSQMRTPDESEVHLPRFPQLTPPDLWHHIASGTPVQLCRRAIGPVLLASLSRADQGMSVSRLNRPTCPLTRVICNL